MILPFSFRRGAARALIQRQTPSCDERGTECRGDLPVRTAVLPGLERGREVVGMKGPYPAFRATLLGEAGEGLPALAGVEDHAVGFGGPRDLGVEFDSVAVVVFALGECLFGLLAAGDVDDRHGDADDLVDLVARGLIGDEQGAGCAGLVRVGDDDLKAGVGFAVERAQEIRLAWGNLSGMISAMGRPR